MSTFGILHTFTFSLVFVLIIVVALEEERILREMD